MNAFTQVDVSTPKFPEAVCFSQFLGVDWAQSANKWRARIRTNGHVRYLGVYSSETAAAHAYDAAARKHHGEFANLNFP